MCAVAFVRFLRLDACQMATVFLYAGPLCRGPIWRASRLTRVASFSCHERSGPVALLLRTHHAETPKKPQSKRCSSHSFYRQFRASASWRNDRRSATRHFRAQEIMQIPNAAGVLKRIAKTVRLGSAHKIGPPMDHRTQSSGICSTSATPRVGQNRNVRSRYAIVPKLLFENNTPAGEVSQNKYASSTEKAWARYIRQAYLIGKRYVS